MITNDDLTELLQPEKFRNWLVEQGDKIVGETRNDNDCPIACYLMSHLPREDEDFDIPYKVSVSGYTIGAYNPNGFTFKVNINTPRWARAFIEKIDFIPLLQPIYDNPSYTDEVLATLTKEELVDGIVQCIPVSGDLALNLLDKALAEI